MADKSAIEWTDASWSPIRARNLKTGKVGWHCEHATTGCEFCYAESMNKRLGTGLPFKPGHRKDIEIFLDEEMLLVPLRWKKPRMIFVCSMTDAFAEFVTDKMLDKVFAVMALSPQHTFQVLTKRADRMCAYLTTPYRKRKIEVACDELSRLDRKLISLEHFTRCFKGDLPLPNVWLGVSTERQQEADERIPLLLQTPAAVRFISAEPLLGPIDLPYVHQLKARPDVPALDWVIVGGESGHGARPMYPDWARSLRDQCADAGVPFFFKQWGNWSIGERILRDDGYLDYVKFQDGDEFHVVSDGHDIVLCGAGEAKTPTHLWRDYWADGHGNIAKKVGKKLSGRLLDGKEHNGFPQAKESAAA